MTRAWYHTFDAWGAQGLHRVQTEEDGITQHLLHWGLTEAARRHVQGHLHTEPECPTMMLALDYKTRAERCSSDHRREQDDELGDWRLTQEEIDVKSDHRTH